MEVEIITIGDELMTGHTVDTNGSYIAEKITAVGLPVKYRSSTGDTVDQMEEVFRLALSRARIVVTTGGLGPTDDDLTKRAIVKVFKRNLIFHEELLEEIKARYRSRGIEMPAINQNQALLPQGATIFPNATGSAVGLCIAEQGRIFISLPGVPSEMKQILSDEVIPYLRNLSSVRPIAVTKLRTTGISESKLTELIGTNLSLEPGVRLAYLPAFSGVDLRIIASAENQAAATEKCEKLSQFLESRCGKHVYGRDDDTLEGTIGQLLIDNDKTISCAESSTGGMLGEIITSPRGASRYFLGSLTTYSNEAKMAMLDVPPETIEQFGAVSEETATQMAKSARAEFGSDYSLSITGIAGPDGGTDEKPVGTAWIGLSSAHASYARMFRFGRDRAGNRARACYAAMEMLRREILDIK